ncbi:MAG: PolC-type DNA polymerase III, partial [Oscillospiraceae bacterium]|nr:PolC-type DNA polymerase III [Oscillospiraceae bacterium]
MSKIVRELFPECMDNDDFVKIAETEVASVEMTGATSVNIRITPANYLPRQMLLNCEIVIREKYKLSGVRILPKYKGVLPDSEILADEILEMRRRISTVNGSFSGCKWHYDAQTSRVTADLRYETAPILQAKNFEGEFAALIKDEFGVEVTIKLVCNNVREAPRPTPHSPGPHNPAPHNPAPHNPDLYSPAPPQPDYVNEDQSKQAPGKESKQASKTGSFYGLPEGCADPEIIFGRDTKAPIMRLSELSQDYINVGVCGSLTGLNIRDSKDGKTVIVSFSLTDKTSSCAVKLLLQKKNQASVERLKNGIDAVVQGDYNYDRYDEDFSIKAKCIALTEIPGRQDTAGKKRVELHMHTNMSTKDAVSSVEDIISRAADWGFPAIAITDHAVAQAFPGAMKQAAICKKEGKPIKVIYGVEANYVNDMVRIVSGRSDMPLSGRFVVFDLETTGLSPVSERITEIGAVAVDGGEVVDEFSTLVDPQMSIPYKVTELTGITNEMVKGAPTEDAAIPKFFEFIKKTGGDCVLVAHNADFDMGFINAACDRLGVVPPAVYLDTVSLSRALYPESSNHKLDTIARLLKLPEFNHHRAADDAKILARILMKEMDELAARYGVTKVSEINTKATGADRRKIRDNHMIILAKNLTGLKNLYKLISWAHVDHFYKHPRVLRSELEEHREGLIIGSACEAGELYRAIMQKKSWGDLCEIASFYDYLEIQPVSNNDFMLRRGLVTGMDEVREFNKTVARLGDKLGKPVVATCDAHYLDPEQDIFRRILLHDKKFDDASIPQKLYLRTTEEMLEEFAYLGAKKAREAVIDNPRKIAAMTEEIDPIPPGTFVPKIPGSDEDLRALCICKAKELYGDPLPEYIDSRLTRELDSIINNGFSALYVTAQKLVADSEAHGYLVGSRGSVGSSFAATVAGISEVNPLPPHYVCPACKRFILMEGGGYGSGFDLPPMPCPDCGEDMTRDGQDIPFETFLGFEGDKQPDIDLNFSGEYQTLSHRYTEELFGKKNVFKAGTIGTIKDKTAFRYVMKYAEDFGLNLSKTEVNRLVQGCVGCKNTTGQHPGGMVVVPDYMEIYDFCPYQHPADKSASDVLTTHFDFHSIHDTILKLDSLGHDVPTIYKYLEEYTDIPVKTIPMSDEQVMSLFASPEALGVTPEEIQAQTGTLSLPELGTAFVRQMLIDTKPKTFADLLQVSGLSHGTDVYLGNAKDLITSGQCTISDVIGTRDNIMTYLIHKGMPSQTAFKITEIVRKGKAKKLLTAELVERMKACGVPKWYVDSCFKIKYMFPKAHAAAYMIAALRLGWYKVYRPAEYYAAYFTVRSEDFDAQAALGGVGGVGQAMEEIRRKGKDVSKTEEDALTIMHITLEALARGVTFLPVDLFKSDTKKYVVEQDDAGKSGIRLP